LAELALSEPLAEAASNQPIMYSFTFMAGVTLSFKESSFRLVHECYSKMAIFFMVEVECLSFESKPVHG
jgi:hypothetical protein